VAREQDEFAEAVMRRINEFRQSDLIIKASRTQAETLRASAASVPPMGHPDFHDLAIGEVGTRDAAAMFLDLRRFTARSFWDPPEDIIRVNVAVITELAGAVQRHGGYVLGLRGDGVFACFDGKGRLDNRGVAAFGVAAGAFALDAVRNSLNHLLRDSGIEPVQVRVGLDFGRLDFVRIGSPAGSEVNVLGFAANFASKCEKYALSWEMVAGETLANLLPQDDINHHGESPVTYTRDDNARSYRFYDVSWNRYLMHVDGIAEQLAGRPVSAVRVA
jgi:class 3 adenylate cyclase